MGIEAQNHAKNMEWQIMLVNSFQTPQTGVDSLNKRVDFYLQAADSAFPYLNLSDAVTVKNTERERFIDEGVRVKEIIETNPDITAEEFLKSNL